MIPTKGLIAVAMVVTLGGCDRSKPVSTRVEPAPNDSAASSQVQDDPIAPVLSAEGASPATQPASGTFFQIVTLGTPADSQDASRLFTFPRARIHIDPDSNTAVLYSDDPKTATTRESTGNSFYIVVPLDSDHPGELDHYTWDFKALPDADQDDVSDGILLDGQKYHLQPVNLHVAFDGEGPTVKVRLWGDFIQYDSAQDADSQVGSDVHVQTSDPDGRNDQPVPIEAKVDSEK